MPTGPSYPSHPESAIHRYRMRQEGAVAAPDKAPRWGLPEGQKNGSENSSEGGAHYLEMMSAPLRCSYLKNPPCGSTCATQFSEPFLPSFWLSFSCHLGCMLTLILVFFPNRSLLLRVLMATQRKEKKGKETESVPGQRVPRPRPQRLLSDSFKIP